MEEAGLVEVARDTDSDESAPGYHRLQRFADRSRCSGAAGKSCDRTGDLNQCYFCDTQCDSLPQRGMDNILL